MTTASNEERLTDLESRHTLTEHVLEQLNEVVVAQADTIDALRREVARLEAQMRISNESEGGEEPPPPHY